MMGAGGGGTMACAGKTEVSGKTGVVAD